MKLQSSAIIDELQRALAQPGDALAPAALAIARLEYPRLDVSRYVSMLDDMGEEAARRIHGLPTASGEAPVNSERAKADADDAQQRIATLSGYLFDDLRFVGNRERYDDPRNSCLNGVLDSRAGIPITLAVVYIEVARRAGITVEGVSFPGHFLLRCPSVRGLMGTDALIIDPFDSGVWLGDEECEALLRQYQGADASLDRRLLEPATRFDIIVRMLVNLKRAYVRLRSFAHARAVSDILVMINPSAIAELRDRGLLSYHLEDFSAALRDLETYLHLVPQQDVEKDEDSRKEHEQIWEHLKAVRRRIASFN